MQSNSIQTEHSKRVNTIQLYCIRVISYSAMFPVEVIGTIAVRSVNESKQKHQRDDGGSGSGIGSGGTCEYR